jgi:hypothetical protein
MDQTVINWLFAGFSGLFSILTTVLFNTFRDIRKDQKELTEKLGAIELLVVGEYVKQREFLDFTRALFVKLDKMDEKLDRKADKIG